MTLAEFVKKWNGKKADYDGAYGAQCVDLYRMYCKEVLGIQQTPPVSGAKDIWSKCGSFKKCEYRPGAYWSPGDILVYKNGQYGHVCVFLAFIGRDSDTYLVFEQDGYKQDGAKIAVRDSKDLIGALYV